MSMFCNQCEQTAHGTGLLHLGITGIRLGPTLPAFITPNVVQVLVDNFAIKPIGETAKADLDTILGAA